MTPLNLIVLYVSDLRESHDFYSALGLAFQEEKHGAGPVHFSTAMAGGAVLELYPQGRQAPSRTRLGFTVEDLAGAIAAVQQVSPDSLLQPPADLDHGLVAVVRDPDGNKVELVAA